jgi:ribulose-phosphate 3-epimerase
VIPVFSILNSPFSILNLIVTPSILSADLARLQDEVDSIADDADWIQIDVMDGHFVPNLSFGAPILRTLQTGLPLDVHLMVANPADRVREFLDQSAANITFHAEAVPGTDARRVLIKAIRDGGASAGIAINPSTPLSAIDDVVNEVDLVLVMSVQPGFGGQAFRPEVLEKVKALRAAHPALMIQMDGGITADTAPACRAAGADNLVSGSFIFAAADRAAAIRSLRGE